MEDKDSLYINEIIRITYKCNWKCRFCNVLKTNNFGERDVINKEIIYQILNLFKKYNKEQLNSLILSFSGGEPTLNKKLGNYIKLAKKLGVGNIQVQTNGSIIYKYPEKLIELNNCGLDELFIANHSHLDEVNKKMGVYYNKENFLKFVNFYLENNISTRILFNIVVNKINLLYIKDFILFLYDAGFINIINFSTISFGFVQPNGYANLNKEEVLLNYDDFELNEINKIVELCKKLNITPDFHFTSPPLCILNFPEYNLEYERLKNLEEDRKTGKINLSNLESFKFLWKEKKKFNNCKNCKNDKYCLGFYKNWIKFVGEEYVIGKVDKFIKENI